MAGSTTPDGIPYPTAGDTLTPLRTWFANIASKTQDALTSIRNSIANHKGIPTAIAAGVHTASTGSVISVGGSATFTIAFPAGRFTAAPSVSATNTSGRMTCAIQSVSAASVVIQVQNWSNAAGPSGAIHWTAVQS